MNSETTGPQRPVPRAIPLTPEQRARRLAVLKEGVELHLTLGSESMRLVSFSSMLSSSGESGDIPLLEREFLAIDSAIEPATFREEFSTDVIPRHALIGYVELLARNAAGNQRRLDRIEMVLTQLLTRALPDGQLEILPEPEFLEIFSQLGTTTQASEQDRERGLAFFVGAAERLEAFKSYHDIFNSGFYVDVQGYKYALDTNRLDPALLYGSILLSVAITNSVMRTAAAAGVSRHTVLGRIASNDARVDEIFKTGDDADLEKRNQRRTRRARAREVAGGTPEPDFSHFTHPKPKRPWTQYAFVVILLCSYLIVRPFFNLQNHLDALPKAKVESLSPLLESAHASSGQAKPVIIGYIDGAKWSVLSPDERQDAAKALNHAMARQGYGSAIIYRERELVVQIESGHVLTVH